MYIRGGGVGLSLNENLRYKTVWFYAGLDGIFRLKF